ncbi:MAG: hypothetical protein ACR2KT_00640 [Methylocella sp.]|nr:MAG: hypothetical protein DLM68_15285 [Hyphomicrobiales bacterium]
MWKTRRTFGALPARPYKLALLGVLALWLGLGSVGLAVGRGLYDDPRTVEGWAWPQIQRSEMVDFNERCHTPALDPKDEKDARWRDGCRKLSARFLQDLLTRAPWREATPYGGVQIKGARIVENLDLKNAKLIRSISILDSRIEGDVNLIRARTDSLISLDRSVVSGSFAADGLHSESDLFLRNGVVFKSEVSLGGAKIDGGVEMTGASFDGKLDASHLQIGGDLLMNSDSQNKPSFKEVSLIGAKVGGQLNMFGASFDGVLNASLLKVGGNLLAASAGQNKTTFRNNVFLLGAEIAGQVTFIGTSFDGSLEAGLLKVDGNLAMNSDAQNKANFKGVTLTSARVGGHIVMTGAGFDGALEAAFLQVGGNLAMNSNAQNKASFKGVALTGAKVVGDISMTGASFAGALNASSLDVGGDLSMQSDADNRTSFTAVNLNGAKIKGQLDMSGATFNEVILFGARVAGNISMIGASFDGTLTAGLLQVDGNLFMGSLPKYKTSFKNVILASAKVAGDIYMPGASFDGALIASLLQVNGNLFMASPPEDKTSFKNVILTGAKVVGDISMPGVSFDGALDAASLQVGGDLLMRNANCADKVDMFFAHVGRDLDLRGTSMGDLDLSGASIAAALKLGGAHESPAWKEKQGISGVLNLRNAHAGNLVDAKAGAWPAKGQLRLDGFTFGHLGGFEGDSGPETRKQEIELWDNWARLDPDYSPASYGQLATAFTNSGDSDAANEIRYLGREREREAACKETWLRGSCFLQTALGSVAGYGIGAYTFKVLPWVLVFWLAGASFGWLARRYSGGPYRRPRIVEQFGASAPVWRSYCP